MLYRSDIETLLLEGYELICTTYESERELIEACANSHEVLNVSYIDTYDDEDYEAGDGFEVINGDMVYKVIRQKENDYNE